jgi:hypothetical protein
MNGIEILSIVQKLDRNKIFRGVFPSDKLPKRKLKKLPAAFVVNLDSSEKKGSHWIGIFVDQKRKGYYFDSYGCNPNVEGIINFLRYQCKKIEIFQHQLQSTNTKVCGSYVIFFLLTMMIDKSTDFAKYFSRNTFINDLFIRKIMNKIKQRILYYLNPFIPKKNPYNFILN